MSQTKTNKLLTLARKRQVIRSKDLNGLGMPLDLYLAQADASEAAAKEPLRLFRADDLSRHRHARHLHSGSPLPLAPVPLLEPKIAQLVRKAYTAIDRLASFATRYPTTSSTTVLNTPSTSSEADRYCSHTSA